LSRQVKSAALLGRRPGYYALRITLVCGLMAGGWVLFALLGDSWWQLATAVFLAVMFTQAAFVGHDAGHRQVFANRRAKRRRSACWRELARRAELRLVGGEAQPAPQPPQPGRQGPGHQSGALVFTAAEAGGRAGRRGG